MTKDEQLKIYAAYLPYGLKVAIMGESISEDDPTPKEFELVAVSTDYIEYHEIGRTVTEESCFDDVFPILYDLSYLTKEIEHEGDVFVPLHRILEEYCFDLSKMDEDYILSFKESLIEIDMSYKTAQMLLSWHFNVFSLTEDQFINKATLIDK